MYEIIFYHDYTHIAKIKKNHGCDVCKKIHNSIRIAHVQKITLFKLL